MSYETFPRITQISKDGVIWNTVFHDGIVGGFTFSNGRKSIIYQGGECGQLCETNKMYNTHRKNKHGAKENIIFGSAIGFVIEELENVLECDILQKETKINV